MLLDNYIAIVEKEWGSQGACASCGWHSLLSEYDLGSQLVINKKKRRLELPCGSGESGHRGVRIYCQIKIGTAIYSRIVGYLRPVQHWHDAKRQEFDDRVEYDVGNLLDEREREEEKDGRTQDVSIL